MYLCMKVNIHLLILSGRSMISAEVTEHIRILNMSVKVKVTQLCPALCDPMDYTVHEILQARILEWVAFPFSRGSSQPRD